MNDTTKLGVRKVLGYAVAAVLLFWLCASLYKEWDQIAGYDWRLDRGLLLISLTLLIPVFLLQAAIWMLILRSNGVNLPFRNAFRINALANLARYAPGRVWQVVGTIYLSKTEGITALQAAGSVVIMQMAALVSAVAVTLLFLSALLPSPPIFGRYLYLLAVFVLVSLFLAGSPLVQRLINMVLERWGRNRVECTVKPCEGLVFLSLYFVLWVLMGIAFYVFSSSLYPVDRNVMPAFAGVFAGAWVIGYLSIITPGGLGVREGIAAYLLSFYLPLPTATAISLAARVWVTVGELLNAGAALALSKWKE